MPQALPQCPGELVTVGLDKLAERLKKYHEMARACKWRAVIDIGSGIPTMTASASTRMRLRAMPRCARQRKSADRRPEVLMDGDQTSTAAMT